MKAYELYLWSERGSVFATFITGTNRLKSENEIFSEGHLKLGPMIRKRLIGLSEILSYLKVNNYSMEDVLIITSDSIHPFALLLKEKATIDSKEMKEIIEVL